MSAEAEFTLTGRDRLLERVTSARWETILAESALAVISLHVLDDNFFQPQPGTSVGDHLVSGLVPFVLLLVFAAVYPRLRPGLRASLAALVGLFGVATGIEGVYYAHSGRIAGDDYTGIAAALAGLVLIGLAVTTLDRKSVV